MNVAFLLVGNKKRHVQLAAYMVRTLRKAMPDAQITQQTDLTTKQVAGVDRVVRLAWDGKFLMTYRLLHLSQIAEPTLVLDVDVVVQRDVSELDCVAGDVVLTTRPNGKNKNSELFETMPYNTGVMYVRNPAFFAECLVWCEQAEKKVQRWGGDQLAVAEIVKRGEFDVRTVSGDLYNFSPKRRRDKNTRRAAIVHYKGAERKRWMLDREKGRKG